MKLRRDTMSHCRRSILGLKIVRMLLCAGVVFGFSSLASAEEIAILKSADITAYSEAISSFKSALPPSFEVTTEYDLQEDMTKGRALAGRIRASSANVVLAVGLKASLAARLEILDIPVIFCLVLNPEKYGLPADNMVGLSLDIPFHQHVKALQTLVPHLSRIGVLFDPQKTSAMQQQLLEDAKTMGIQIIAEPVESERDVPIALNNLKDRIDALWLLPDSTVLTENTLDFLMSTTLEAHIPVVGFSAGLVHSGAVVAAYFHYADIGFQAAQLAQQLAKHPASPLLGTLMPHGRIYHSINKKAAEFFSFSLTPDILRQFDEQF